MIAKLENSVPRALMPVTETSGQCSEIRALSDHELDDVNGGFILALASAALCFTAGFTVGMIAANYKVTGNFWGDINL
jgi:lactobin A/cerein 7B family class IIb bacteriocin